MFRIVGQGLVLELLRGLEFPSPLMESGSEVTGIRHAERMIERQSP